MRTLLLSAILVIGIYGCSTDNNLMDMDYFSSEDKTLQIITRTLTSQTPNFVQVFAEGSEIGLHVTNGEIGQLYNELPEYMNIKAKAVLTDGRIRWQQTPEISLGSNPAAVYAYYPYQPQVDMNPALIPVNISPDATQTPDYMYGTHAIGQKKVNRTSPIVCLSMNHALSLISFQVKLDKQVAKKTTLTAVQLGNKAGGSTLSGRGTLNIKTGRIAGTGGTNATTRLETYEMLSCTLCNDIHMKVIPTSHSIQYGDVEALFIIDGKRYKYIIPSGTEWKKGHSYLYKLVFDGTTLHPSKVTVTGWTPGSSAIVS